MATKKEGRLQEKANNDLSWETLSRTGKMNYSCIIFSFLAISAAKETLNPARLVPAASLAGEMNQVSQFVRMVRNKNNVMGIEGRAKKKRVSKEKNREKQKELWGGEGIRENYFVFDIRVFLVEKIRLGYGFYIAKCLK